MYNVFLKINTIEMEHNPFHAIGSVTSGER